tara:strand:- start:1431 stop:2033 length:603 start_codon:yes stop_codon:yes gene_type:complete
MASIKILDSNATIQKEINMALSGQVNKRLTKVASKVRSQVIPVIQTALISSPEISSLSGGTLRGEFGLTSDPSSQLVSAIVDSLEVRVTPVDANLNGGFILVMQPSNFANLFSLSLAEQPIEGGSIPWLKWLLTLGDSVIIADFGVEFGAHGRTGQARMARKPAPYKVNSTFSGTPDNNFITRAIDRVFPQIQEIIRRAL